MREMKSKALWQDLGFLMTEVKSSVSFPVEWT